MEDNKLPSEEELVSYLERIKSKDPQFDLVVEFGRYLMRPYDSLNESELKRYNELKEILKDKKPIKFN